MNLDDFLAETPAAVPSLPAAGVAPEALASEKPPAVGSDGLSQTAASNSAGSDPAQAPGASQEPEFVTALTPSGIEVLYQWAPKRLYRVRQHADDPLDNPGVDIVSEWVEVPSVTTVLGALDKPGLPWWGMKTGVEGVLELASRGLVREMYSAEAHGSQYLAVPGRGLTGSTLVPADVDNVVDLLTEFKLTVNHVRDQAGDRGTSVHDALEAWALRGIHPQPEIYPEHERGYVLGLVNFIEHAKIEPGAAEVMVGSVEHGFAGRYDLRAILADSLLTTKVYPKRADKVEDIPGGSYLIDLKTSKGVYPTHQMQLEAYEAASVECGYTPTDYRAVLRVTADGNYEFHRSRATFEDFLAVKGAYDAVDRLSRRRK